MNPVNVSLHQSKLSGKNAELIRTMMPAIILIIVVLVIKKMMEKMSDNLKAPFVNMGVMDSKEQAAAAIKADSQAQSMENLGSNSPFSTNYYREKSKNGTKSVHLLTAAAQDALAKRIYNAIGFFTDDVDAIISAIKQCTYKTQISFMSEKFATLYAKDLFNFLQDKLDRTDQKIAFGKIVNYVNALPVGTI